MGSAIQRLNNRPLRIVFRLALKTHTLGLQHLPWMIHFAKRDLKTTITTILCILRECILYFPGSRHSQWGDGGLYSNRPNTVEYENPETILWKKGSYTAISCFCPQLAGRGARKLVIVKWLQTMILYCWNITYHRKLHLISSSRHNPLGSCGQSSSSRLFAPCYHSLPRFPSLARRLSCPTNVG